MTCASRSDLPASATNAPTSTPDPVPDVSVLVPVLDEEAHLRDTAERMLAQSYSGPAEFIFIDGGSRDSSREIVADLAARDPRVCLLDNPHRRTPHALNIGLSAARGEVIVRMDAHTRYPRGYLETGVERLRRGDALSVSGPQLAVGDAAWSRRIALALRTPLGVGSARFRRSADEEFEVDTGFTGMWFRSTLEGAGGWDEEWLTDQDCELAFRLVERTGGRHVCVPAMAAEYVPRDSLRGLARQYWQYGFHKVKTFRRHPAAMRPSHVLPAGVALASVAAVAAPGPLRSTARLGMVTYGAALAATAATAARDAPIADATALPLVHATMHLSYGFGMLAGVRRYGAPVAALAGILRRLAP